VAPSLRWRIYSGPRASSTDTYGHLNDLVRVLLAAVNGQEIDGRTLKVELAKPSAPRGSGGNR
jgi:hypothetical protein